MNKKIMFIIIVCSLLLGELDNIIDNYFFLDRPVFTSFFDSTPHEMFTRFSTSAVILVFGLLVARYSFLTEESQGRFRQLFDNINDLIFVHEDITRNPLGRFIEVNQSAWRHLGYNREELLHTPPLHIFAPEARQDLVAQMKTLAVDKHVIFESLQLGKKGRRIPVEIESHLFEINGKIKIISICRDISARQAAQAFTSQLLAAQETERRRISMELHDELGQDLTFLKFQMGLLTKEAGLANIKTSVDLNSLLTQVDELIEKVRRITQEMSPAALEELGLSSAIRFLMELFGERVQQVQTTLEIDEIDSLFCQSTQIHIFRIIQESLTNIIKHAHASQISVSVKQQGDRLVAVVADDGLGFDVPATMEDKGRKGLGLAAIEERLRLLGGTLDIWSQKGSGTRLTCYIPIVAKGSEDGQETL